MAAGEGQEERRLMVWNKEPGEGGALRSQWGCTQCCLSAAWTLLVFFWSCVQSESVQIRVRSCALHPALSPERGFWLTHANKLRGTGRLGNAKGNTTRELSHHPRFTTISQGGQKKNLWARRAELAQGRWVRRATVSPAWTQNTQVIGYSTLQGASPVLSTGGSTGEKFSTH